MLGDKEIRELFNFLEKVRKEHPLVESPLVNEVGREEVFFFLADNISYELSKSGIEHAELERPAGRN